MKKVFTFLSLVFALQSICIGQTANGKPITAVYRRSSLHTMIMESENYPYKDTVLKAYNTAPFPDKYNDHTIGAKSFNPLLYRLNAQPGDSVIDSTAMAKIDDYQPIINNYMMREKIAAKLVAKWFNRHEDGTMDMNLIGERGYYNASDMAARIAANSARGTAALADAGEELIGNTFVVVSRLNFVSNEVPALVARTAAYIAADQIPFEPVRIAAKVAADVAYNKAREGYSVWTTSYLYKLRWNDSIAAVFYNDLWTDKSNPNPERAAKFFTTDIFGMDFVGSEKSNSLVLFGGDRNQSEIIQEATVRTVDNVYTKLQKKYDVFKTKTPLYTGNPITAKIGLKEGLEGGDRFEVLEQVQDADGKTKYVRKGVVKVDGKKIWDNRFVAGTPQKVDSTATTPALDRTFFKGGDDYYSGMLIRQIK